MLIKAWAPHFKTTVRIRGRASFQAGKVERLPAGTGELIRAEVTDGRAHTVVIRNAGPDATAQCTCPDFNHGSFCQHIWAALLAAHHDTMEGDEPAHTEAANHQPRPPKARKRTGESKPRQSTEPGWSNRMQLLRPNALGAVHADSIAPPMPQQVCYLVRGEQSRQHGGLVIQLHHRRPGPSGWSALRALRINDDRLSEISHQEDRELCALLLGGARVSESHPDEQRGDPRPHSVFRLPRAAQRALLRRMIATGRCMLEYEPGSALPYEPLTWDSDEPWVLWAVGSVEDDNLLIESELRRGDKRVPLSDPELLLSGPGGIVIQDGRAAPFDDCGADRWVSLFRDRSPYDNAEAGMRVPLNDLNRFFGRLYRVPDLPELDLPPGLGVEQLRGPAVPHIEVYHANAASDTQGNGSRGRCFADVWFRYGDNTTKINLGQLGKFVLLHAQAETDDAEPDNGPAIEQTDPDTDPQHTPTDHQDEGPDGDPLNKPINVIRRDPEAEAEAVDLLMHLGLRWETANGHAGRLTVPAKRLPEIAGTLLNKGWVVSADRRLLHRPGTMRLSVTSNIDWFELRGVVAYETADGQAQDVALPEILSAVKSGKSMVRLGDGSMGMLPEQWLQDNRFLLALGANQEDHLRYSGSQTALLDALISSQDAVELDEPFREARKQLEGFNGVSPLEPHDTFSGLLRPYQKEGLGWMSFLRVFGVGGILADDMGLGKTVQVIAMLDRIYNGQDDNNGTAQSDKSEPRPPTLIVVPRSVVYNWIDEAQRFAPGLKVQAYSGTDRHEMRDDFADHHVIITSYGLLRRDALELRKHRFEYLVLDEAQAIKNASSQSAKAARVITTNHRLALTGTPVENHLGDLWSIFEFLNPGVLGSHSNFSRLVRGPKRTSQPRSLNPVAALPEEQDPADQNGDGLEDGQANEADAHNAGVTKIAQALRPFILRRTKRQVLKDLPEKTEQTIICQMEPPQRKLYDGLLKHYRQTLLGQADPGTKQSGTPGGGSTMFVLEALLRLRQAACHPGLIDEARAGEASAKMEVLSDRLEDLIEEGHKALVFSQFTSMLSLVKNRLDDQGIVYEYLDGQTRQRRERVERFQNDPDCPVFLISLKAGGLGLNLTAAEYVFILDPWWNPAVEAQAIDRTHRIGQTQRVFAYRLICQDTVEQRIAELQSRKQALAEAIIGEQTNLLSNLTRQDLELLLS